MTADYNASCEGSCGSLLSIEACSKQSTPESHAVIKGSKHGLMFEKFGSFVVATYRLFTSALDTTTEFLNCDIVTLIIIIAFIYFVYKKIIVPFNYVQDLDLPSVTQTKKNMINLTRMLRRIGKKLPPPYPNGWYGVMESSELKEGAVKQVDCFGEALAVFRGEGGAVHALDAHCPHLGANMAAGGAVRGDCLECPFHRWRFSGDSGACVSIPGVDTVPKSAAVRTWECREIDGAVFVWFHCDGEPPSYEIPSVAKVASGDWTYMARNDFLIPCHIQDIPENGADLAHLNALHGDHLVAGKLLPTSDIYNILGKHVWSGIWKPSENPHIASVELKHDIRLFDKFSIIDVEVTATQVGPSYVLMDIRHKLCHVVILQTVTPIAPLVQRVTHRLYAPPLFKPLANLLMWAETVMFHRDVMVWASKQFVQQPLLVKTDKCLKSYRNWFKQFYSETSTTFEDALKNISSPIDW